MKQPYLIQFNSTLSSKPGILCFAETPKEIPFPISRIYWIFGVDHRVTRGNHAHKKGEQVMIALHGKVTVELENKKGECFTFLLDKGSEGLFVPGNYWRKVTLEKDTVLLSITSTVYDSDNYIRDYREFKGNEL